MRTDPQSPTEDVLPAVAAGTLVVVDEHRENEADLVIAAGLVTPGTVPRCRAGA